MRRQPPVVAAVVAVVAASSPPCHAQDEAAAAAPRPLVEAVRVFPAQARFDRPLLVAHDAGDPGIAYVVEQPGRISRVSYGEDDDARHVFLDITAAAYCIPDPKANWEEGLLGFAFDPDYAANGHVFVYWSEQTDVRQGDMGSGKQARSSRQSVISRFGTARDDDGRPVVDRATELRVMEIFQPFGNHNGGTIVFGPDGMLYVALGDGGAARDPFKNGQDKGTLLGSVLRIDVRGATREQPYRVPADNPFVGEAGARGELWCYGLRNPWRIAFDRATGALWCGDVGQDRLEEVDILVKGGNYGWNLMEADEVFRRRVEIPPELIGPVAQYPRSQGVSITGGHVYRGKAIPALVGWYVYGDFATLRLWAVEADAAGDDREVRQIGRAPGQLSSFAEAPDGELLITCFDGNVYRLELVPDDGG